MGMRLSCVYPYSRFHVLYFSATANIPYRDLQQSFHGSGFFGSYTPDLLPAQLQGMNISGNDLGYRLLGPAPRRFSNLPNSGSAPPPHHTSHGTTEHTYTTLLRLLERTVSRIGDPRPPRAFSTITKHFRHRNSFSLFEYFNNCRKKHHGRQGFKRKGNLLAHLRRYHEQNILKGGF